MARWRRYAGVPGVEGAGVLKAVSWPLGQLTIASDLNRPPARLAEITDNVLFDDVGNRVTPDRERSLIAVVALMGLAAPPPSCPSACGILSERRLRAADDAGSVIDYTVAPNCAAHHHSEWSCQLHRGRCREAQATFYCGRRRCRR